MAIWKASGNQISRSQQAHKIQGLAGTFCDLPFFPFLPTCAHQRMEDLALCIGMQTDHHVLNRGHLAKQSEVLEGTADTRGRAPLRRHGPELVAIEINSAARWEDMTRNQVQKCRLTRAVRTDKAVHVACVHR